MNVTTVAVLLLVTMSAVAAEAETRDLTDGLDSEDLERKHKKRKKHQQNGCGYGKTFGKFFGFGDYTYISAPVMNYFFGCGGFPAPIYGYGGHGHGGQGGHGGHGGYGGHGNHGGNGGFGGFGGYPGFVNAGFNPGFNQNYNQGTYNRPFQNVVSAAASGLGSVISDYLNHPRKTQKIINRQVNQFLRPIYRLI